MSGIANLTGPPPTPNTGSGGFSSIGSRFTVFSVNTVTGGGAGGNQDTTNQYLQGRYCCPVYVSGNRVRACFALVAYNGASPVIGETPTNGCTLRCSLESPSGQIVQMTPTLGPRTGADGMSIAAAGGSLVHFEALVPMNAGDVWWVRVYAVKNVATDSLPLNVNLSNYTTNTQPDPMDCWGDGIGTAAVDCTVGAALTAVAGGTATCGFGPCAVLIVPSNPYSQACATFVVVNDSTGIGQSDTDSWRHGWPGREALTKRRPLLNTACPGEASTAATISQFAIRNQIIGMAGKYAFIGDGWNDMIIGGAGQSATVIANRLLFAKMANANGCISCPMTLWPASTSSDSWTTLANQTPQAYEAGRLAINADARNPGTPGVYTGPVMDVESYMKGLNGSSQIVANWVTGPYASLAHPWGTGFVSSVAAGTITPSGVASGAAGFANLGGVLTALNGADPQSNEYGNFAGYTAIVMTSGANNGTVYPITGNNGTLFAVTGSTAGLALNDTFNIFAQLSQGVHQGSRQQIALAANFPMHRALGWA